MDVVLLMGLAALGYAIALPKKKSKSDLGAPVVREQMFGHKGFDEIPVVQATNGHGNMVPFFGANRTQTTYSDGHESLLDTYTGMGKNTFFRKQESGAFLLQRLDVVTLGRRPSRQTSSSHAR